MLNAKSTNRNFLEKFSNETPTNYILSYTVHGSCTLILVHYLLPEVQTPFDRMSSPSYTMNSFQQSALTKYHTVKIFTGYKFFPHKFWCVW